MKRYFFIAAMLAASLLGGCKDRSVSSNAVQIDSLQDIDPIEEEAVNVESTFSALQNDSFIVKYRQKVNGYSVKAVARLKQTDLDAVIQANLYFTKRDKTFMLSSKCFGDTAFCNGRLDPEGVNLSVMSKYRGKEIEAAYPAGEDLNGVMRNHTPFFFCDVDFDGIEELIIVSNSLAVRYGNLYDAYRIVEGKPFRIDYPPYSYSEEAPGMNSYPEFDYKKKTIACPYPEGELEYNGCTTYGISKKKDVIVINGHRYYFNQWLS